MSKVGEGIDKGRTKADAKAEKIFADTFSILGVESEVTEDAYGGTTADPDTIAEDIPCKVEELSTFERLQQSGTVSGATSRIKTVFRDETVAILPTQRLVVAARGEVPERTFEVVGPPKMGSNKLFVYIDVSLKG